MKADRTNPAWPGWTRALAAAGLIALPSLLQGEDVLRPTVITPTAVTLGGYVDTSAIWRMGESSDSGATKGFPNTLRSPGRLYDVPARQNGFNLNAVSLELDKPLEPSGWSAGYRVQLLAGPDAVLRNSYSLDSGPRDIALNEAYVTAHAPLGNGLDFRLGYFTSPLGYEVYDSCRNPNYSRSYGYYIEPKAHTGLTVRYEFAPWLNAMAGVGNNYSPFINARSALETSKTYLALINVTGAGFGHPDVTLTLGYTGGNTATAGPTDSHPRIHNCYAGLQVPFFAEGLTLGVAYDYQFNAVAHEPAAFF